MFIPHPIDALVVKIAFLFPLRTASSCRINVVQGVVQLLLVQAANVFFSRRRFHRGLACNELLFDGQEWQRRLVLARTEQRRTKIRAGKMAIGWKESGEKMGIRGREKQTVEDRSEIVGLNSLLLPQTCIMQPGGACKRVNAGRCQPLNTKIPNHL